MKVAITGASGLVGHALAEALKGTGDEPISVTRQRTQVGSVFWDPAKGEIEAEKLEGIDAIVHLAGENIAGGRWTKSFKQKILDSRVNGTRLIAETILKLSQPPKVFISTSAVGYYGDRGDATLTEDSRGGEGFLADVCRAWEGCADRMIEAPIRLAKLRFGVVLSKRGGTLPLMLTPFRLGLGGVIGPGTQYMSWVTIDDVVRAIQFVQTHDDASGVFNVTSPDPVTNREVTKTLGRALHRPTVLGIPTFAARLALGEMADELLLSSTRAIPEHLQKIGFRFDHPKLKEALEYLLK